MGDLMIRTERLFRYVPVMTAIVTCGAPVAASTEASVAPGQRDGARVVTREDLAATSKLLDAEYKLAKVTLARRGAVQAAVGRAAEALGRECKGVLAGVPDESVIEEEGPDAARPLLSGRAQGERARSELEKQTIYLEIDEAISAPAYGVLRGPYEAYIAAVDRLAWSAPAVNALVHEGATRLRKKLAGPPVAVCPEMRAWAASGFHVLPSGSKRLAEAREARSKQAAQGNLEVLLRPSEDRAARAVARRVSVLKERLRAGERADERLVRATRSMELALGERLSGFVKQQHAPVIGRGRTHAGTTFVIRRGTGGNSPRSCRHEVGVEVREHSGGTSGGVCLGQGAHAHPSGSCSGPVETIEFATPPDVRRARVRLSDGRIVPVSVVHVPVKDGGPAGVIVDAFRGYKPYPVSVQELSRAGRVLRTVSLSGLRCTRQSAVEGPGPPRFVDLATAIAPSGERLTIEGTLVRFQGKTEFFLGPQPGMHKSGGPKKQFQWSLSTECAPHSYSLLDGILNPPGATVLIRTPAGLVALAKVELPASMHAAGPLFYGVYATPPTEIVVERSDGSVLYTESLAAKAAEETEFCEGYAER